MFWNQINFISLVCITLSSQYYLNRLNIQKQFLKVTTALHLTLLHLTLCQTQVAWFCLCLLSFCWLSLLVDLKTALSIEKRSLMWPVTSPAAVPPTPQLYMHHHAPSTVSYRVNLVSDGEMLQLALFETIEESITVAWLLATSLVLRPNDFIKGIHLFYQCLAHWPRSQYITCTEHRLTKYFFT